MSKQEHAAFCRKHIKVIRGNVIFLKPAPRKTGTTDKPQPPAAA